MRPPVTILNESQFHYPAACPAGRRPVKVPANTRRRRFACAYCAPLTASNDVVAASRFPLVLTLANKAKVDFANWLRERKNRRRNFGKALRALNRTVVFDKYWLENGKNWLKPLDDFDTT